MEKTLSGDKFVTAGYADADTTQFKVTKLFEGTDYLLRVIAENRVSFGPPATLDKPVKARLPFGMYISNSVLLNHMSYRCRIAVVL